MLFLESSCNQGRVEARTIRNEPSLTTIASNGDFIENNGVDCSGLSLNNSFPLLVPVSPGSVDFAISPSFTLTTFGIGLRATIGNSELTTLFTLELDDDNSFSMRVRDGELVFEVKLDGIVGTPFVLQPDAGAITGDVTVSYVANINVDEHTCCVTKLNNARTCSLRGLDLSSLLLTTATNPRMILDQQISSEELFLQQMVLIRDIDTLINFEEGGGLNFANVEEFQNIMPDLEDFIDENDDDDENNNQLEGKQLMYLIGALVFCFLLSLTIFGLIMKIKILRGVIKLQNVHFGFYE